MQEEKLERAKQQAPIAGRKFTVRVHRANIAPENANLPIIVNPIGPTSLGGKKEFMPGQPVELTIAQINVLKNAVEETEFELPDSSGIYEERDPIAAARSQFPEFQFRRNKVNGSIIAFRRSPNYIVESVEGLPQ